MRIAFTQSLAVLAAVVAMTLACLPCVGLALPVRSGMFDDNIRQLVWEIRSLQWNDSVPCEFPFQMGHEKGKYANDIHFNFVGNPTQQLLRSIGIPDNNIFVTTFVLEALMESMLLAPDLVPADDVSASMAVEALLSGKDRNLPSDTPVFGFWPQVHLNGTGGLVGPSWEQWPINLANAAAQGVSWDLWLKSVLDDLGEGSLWNEFGPALDKYLAGLEILFQIPSDADDTSVTLALQQLFVKSQHLIPNAFQLWNSSGFVHSKAFEHMLQFSYCPRHPDMDKNTIDPRSYFWAHEYLNNNVTGNTSCIVATWMQNITYSGLVALNRTAGPQMPLSVNNIDPTVGCNSLYAFSATLLYGAEDSGTWFSSNPAMRQLYLSTADFVGYALTTQPTQQRPDLEMLYYPPEYNLVWFVARHLRMLNSYLVHRNTTVFPVAEMNTVYSTLTAALRSGGMEYFSNTMNTSCWAGAANSTDVCWDGFLGNADINALNESTPHYQDRFFSTAVVLNGYIDGWSYTSENSSTVYWLADTPQYVKEIARRAASYLQNAMANANTSYDNAFFSGSGKYWEQYQFWYPANQRFDFRTGEAVDCANITIDELQANYYFWMMGASGAINDTEFKSLSKVGCAGISAPTWFTGYNGQRAFRNGNDGKAWPFWSAPVMSKALALQALAKLRALGGE